MKNLTYAEPFLHPVDKNVPSYYDEIKYPIGKYLHFQS